MARLVSRSLASSCATHPPDEARYELACGWARDKFAGSHFSTELKGPGDVTPSSE